MTAIGKGCSILKIKPLHSAWGKKGMRKLCSWSKRGRNKITGHSFSTWGMVFTLLLQGLCWTLIFLQHCYNLQTLLSWLIPSDHVPELSELLLTPFFLILPFLKYIFPEAELCPAVGPMELAGNTCVQYRSHREWSPCSPPTVSAWAPVPSTHEISVIRT